MNHEVHNPPKERIKSLPWDLKFNFRFQFNIFDEINLMTIIFVNENG